MFIHRLYIVTFADRGCIYLIKNSNSLKTWPNSTTAPKVIMHFKSRDKHPLLDLPYLCSELGQLCTCLSAKASFVAVVTFKPIVFGGLWPGGNNVASCDDVFVVGLFTDDFPELCAVATGGPRHVLGNVWIGVASVGTLGGLLGTSEAVHWGITGATSPVVFSTIWLGRVAFTASVCFGPIASGKTTIFITGIGALVFGGDTFLSSWASVFGEAIPGVLWVTTDAAMMGFGTSFWFGGMFLFSTLFIFCVWWWDRSDLGVTVDVSFSPLICNLGSCWSLTFVESFLAWWSSLIVPLFSLISSKIPAQTQRIYNIRRYYTTMQVIVYIF